MGRLVNMASCIAATTAVLLGIFVQLMSPIDPAETLPAEMPPLTELAVNTRLAGAERVFQGELRGPESLVATEKALYMSLADGRIARLVRAGEATAGAGVALKLETVVRTGAALQGCGKRALEHLCGRPLGMRLAPRRFFARDCGEQGCIGDEQVLLVADTYKGLLMVSDFDSEGRGAARITTLATTADGDAVPFSLLNDLAVGADGKVYMTETSRKFQRRTIFWSALEGSATGRLLVFDPRTRGVEVLADGLWMPNGITLEPSGDALVFSCDQVRLCRFDLRSHSLTRLSTMPGTVDNVRLIKHGDLRRGGLPAASVEDEVQGDEGFVYVAGLGSRYSKPFALLKFLADKPTLRKLIATLVPYDWLVAAVPKIGMTAIVSLDGQLLETWQDRTAATVSWASEVEPWGGYLWIGSFQGDGIARINASRVWNSIR